MSKYLGILVFIGVCFSSGYAIASYGGLGWLTIVLCILLGSVAGLVFERVLEWLG